MKNRLAIAVLFLLLLLISNNKYSANVISGNANELKQIVQLTKKDIDEDKIENAIHRISQCISLNESQWKDHLMEIDYSLYILTKEIKGSKNYLILKKHIKPLIIKLRKVQITDINSIAYNDFCIGVIYMSFEEFSNSEKFLNYSKKIFEKLRNEEYLLYVNNTLSLLYAKVNDFEKAELFIEKTLFYLTKVNKLTAIQRYEIWYFSSLNSFKIKNYKLALTRLDSANNYLNYLSNDIKANLFNCYGITYKNLEYYDKSEVSYKKAVELRKKEKQVNILDLSRDYQNYSELLSKTGRGKEAVEMGLQSCKLIQQVMGSKSGSSSIAFSSLASVYFENKFYNKAFEWYNKALLASTSDTILESKRLFPDSSSVIYFPEFIKALKGKALVLRFIAKENKKAESDCFRILQQSLICYLEVVNQLEKLRSTYQFDEGKLLLSENEREVYNQAVETAFDLFSLTGNNDYINIAFSVSERSKAGLLFEKISLLSARSENSESNRLFNFDQKLRKEISTFERIIKKNNISGQVNSHKNRAKLYKLYEIQESFFSLLKTLYPGYYNTWLFPSVVSLSQLQDKLSPDESFIEFYLSDSALFSIIVNKDSKCFIKKSINNNLTEQINNYCNEINLFSIASSATSGFHSFTGKSYDLYSLFIKPLHTLIKDKSVVISADGIVNYLPFETLISENNSDIKVDYGKLKYLVKEHRISYAYSASLYCSEYHTGIVAQNKVLAFAPNYTTTSPRLAEVITRSGLSYLKGAREEVKNIEKIISSDVYSNILATESEFKETAPGYSVIHLAMHGQTDNDDPLNSELIFENGGKGNDGLLHAWEIYNMQLNASLVVLSACNTGSGKIRKGEGVMSLARAFTYAGCPSVVMTLWSVNDLSSTGLMQSFYTGLSEGENKAKALQNAKTEYISGSGPARSHPYYWAGYVVVGDNSPVEISRGHNRFLYTATFSIGIFAILIFVIKRKRLL